MAYVTTPTELQDEVLRRLGAPTIQVEVTPEQLKDCIDQAIELYTEYHYNGARKIYLALEVQQTDVDNGGVFLIDRPVMAISSVVYNSDPANNAGMILGRDFMNALSGWNGYSTGRGQNSIWSQYNTFSLLTADLWQQYMNAFNDMFRDDIMYEWNRHTGELQIFNHIEVGQVIVLEAWVPTAVPLSVLKDPSTDDGEWNPDHVENQDQPQYNTAGVQNILNDRWIKDYTTALVKQVNGTVLKKFKGQKLPGGIEVDGQGMYQEAQEEIKSLREELYSLEAPLPFFFG